MVLASCSYNSNKESLKDNIYGQIRTLSCKTSEIITDENTLYDYNIQSFFTTKKNEECILAYNYQTHSFDIFNLSTRKISHTKLKDEGKDAIIPDLQGLYVHNEDSVWAYNSGIIYLLDLQGIVKRTIRIDKLQNEPAIILTNYSIASVKLFYNQSKNALYYATLSQNSSPEYFANEYSLTNSSIVKYPLTRHLNDDVRKSYGWKQIPNITFTDKYIIYNFPIESDIYRIDISTNKNERHGGKSKYTENKASMLNSPFTFEEAERHKIENIHFYEIQYDKAHNVYYRLHVDKTDFSKTNNTFSLYQKKQPYLQVFDEDFKVINEIALAKNRYNYINNWVCTKDGLLISVVSDPLIDEQNEIFLFDIFALRN